MIKSIRHKGLRKFFETGNMSGIQAKHAKTLRRLLTLLNTIRDFNGFPDQYKLHPLKGGDRWSVRVSANWRLTFEFRNGNIYLLDYEDYH